MLKDEPDDLTHLAPVAGDCVPLEDNHLLSDMFDDILLRENFAPLLLADEPPADPFIAYRDFQDPSPQLLSPNLSKVSPIMNFHILKTIFSLVIFILNIQYMIYLYLVFLEQK